MIFKAFFTSFYIPKLEKEKIDKIKYTKILF